MEGEFLASTGTLFADEAEGFDLPEFLFGDAKVGEDLTNGGEGGRLNRRRLRSLIRGRQHDSRWRARGRGDGETGFGAAYGHRAAGDCNETVPKPYLFGRKGDQLRAKAESPKTCK